MNLKLWGLTRSLWVYHVNAGACNNCDIEILDLLTPRFDVERFGIKLVGSPRHADVLAVTGIVTRQIAPRLKEVYLQTPKPCIVLAIGACALTMGIFKSAYHAAGPVDKVIKEADPNAIIAYVPGCPPKPEAMILGVVKAVEHLKNQLGRPPVGKPEEENAELLKIEVPAVEKEVVEAG